MEARDAAHCEPLRVADQDARVLHDRDRQRVNHRGLIDHEQQRSVACQTLGSRLSFSSSLRSALPNSRFLA